jgi:uncharacterized lipoprotein YmbA
VKKLFGAIPVCLSLAACGDSNARFLIETADVVTQTRVRVASIEVREVSLPSYASASEIVVEQSDGALRPVSNALWADDPVRGVTGALARSLALRSTAIVSAEPWPLADRPAVQLEVRVDRMVAGVDGTFRLTGQFALSSPQGQVRDSLTRFAVTVPLADTAPGAVAASTGQAIDALAAEILEKLRR